MICFQFGTHDNPCRCKVLGPTLGFFLGAISTLVYWPAGLLTRPFNKSLSHRYFASPVNVWDRTSRFLPV